MPVSLVDAFNAEDYPQYHVDYFKDPNDSRETYGLYEKYKQAVAILKIEDYKIFFNKDHIEARFTDLSDSFRFSVALKPAEKVEVDYFHADMDSSNRSLDRVRKSLRKLVHAMGLHEKIRFELDRANKAVAVFAADGQSFIDFDEACRSTPSRKIMSLTNG